MRKVDTIGTRFNRLVVMDGVRYNEMLRYWEQQYCCDCGNTIWRRPSVVRNGNTKSCGCLNVEKSKIRARKHGAKSGGMVRLSYTCWQQMKDRCLNPNSKNYNYYKGIPIDPAWLDYNNFVLDMGEPPCKYTLDRMDNTKGYSKDNCRWASRLTQSRNRAYCNKYTYDGFTGTSSEWATKLNICTEQFRNRVRKYKKDPVKFPFESIFIGKQTWLLQR